MDGLWHNPRVSGGCEGDGVNTGSGPGFPVIWGCLSVSCRFAEREARPSSWLHRQLREIFGSEISRNYRILRGAVSSRGRCRGSIGPTRHATWPQTLPAFDWPLDPNIDVKVCRPTASWFCFDLPPTCSTLTPHGLCLARTSGHIGGGRAVWQKLGALRTKSSTGSRPHVVGTKRSEGYFRSPMRLLRTTS